jgi:hypothetical protein
VQAAICSTNKPSTRVSLKPLFFLLKPIGIAYEFCCFLYSSFGCPTNNVKGKRKVFVKKQRQQKKAGKRPALYAKLKK